MIRVAFHRQLAADLTQCEMMHQLVHALGWFR